MRLLGISKTKWYFLNFNNCYDLWVYSLNFVKCINCTSPPTTFTTIYICFYLFACVQSKMVVIFLILSPLKKKHPCPPQPKHTAPFSLEVSCSCNHRMSHLLMLKCKKKIPLLFYEILLKNHLVRE